MGAVVVNRKASTVGLAALAALCLSPQPGQAQVARPAPEGQNMTLEQWCSWALDIMADPQIQTYGDPYMKQALLEKVRNSGCLDFHGPR